MHVYLFLAGHDSAAAGRLCEALGRRMDDDHIWVWYTVAPLIPVLREADWLARAARFGCRRAASPAPFPARSRI